MSETRRAGADKSRLFANAAAPGASPEAVWIYGKIVAGVTQLWAQPDDGTEYQLTPTVVQLIEVFSPPEAWFVTEVSAGASGDMGALVSQNFSTVQLIRAGSVVGLSVRFTGPITAGAITITVTLNGAPTALSIDYTAPSTGSVATWPIGTLNYAAGDELGLSYSATGTLEPDRTLNVEAWLELTESL